MGQRDIMPLTSVLGGHTRTVGLPVGANTTKSTANTSWLEGEPVTITAASGDIDCSADGALDPTSGLIYIAAGSSEGMITKFAGLAGTTGDADGQLCPCYVIDGETEFVTRNVFNNSDTNIGPAGSGAMTNVTIGATCDLWRDNTSPGTVSGDVNGDMGFDINGDGMVITKILDANGRPTSVTSDTAHWVVAKLIT